MSMVEKKNLLGLGPKLTQRERRILAIAALARGKLSCTKRAELIGPDFGKVEIPALVVDCEFYIAALDELKAKLEANETFNRFSGEVDALIKKLREFRAAPARSAPRASASSTRATW
jgi:hypothetical protein